MPEIPAKACNRRKKNSKNSGSATDSGDSADSDDKNHADDPNGTTSDKQDTGNYADGTYSINGQYGPVGEDTIDVHVTVKDQTVTNVEVIGHPFTSISKKHQNAFAEAINGVVDGKPLKDLKVDKVAGASWTSEAFNKAWTWPVRKRRSSRSSSGEKSANVQ